MRLVERQLKKYFYFRISEKRKYPNLSIINDHEYKYCMMVFVWPLVLFCGTQDRLKQFMKKKKPFGVTHCLSKKGKGKSNKTNDK